MRPTLALALAALLASTPLARAHDFYHEEFWHEDCDDHHWHGPYVSPSKLDMAWELFETGRHLANEHSLVEAQKPIRQAIELEPRVARFHLALGLILRDQGNKDQAVAELKLARKFGYGWVEEDAYWALKDLGVDSMMALEIVTAIEKKYQIKIEEKELEQVSTLERATRLVETKLAAR